MRGPVPVDRRSGQTPASQGFQGKIMHAFKTLAALLGLVMLTGACSSERDEARPLPIGKTGSDAAFSFYDNNSDLTISASDIYEVEKRFPQTRIGSEETASHLMADFDLDADGQLDNIEFTGMVNARILAGVHVHPEWTSRRLSR